VSTEAVNEKQNMMDFPLHLELALLKLVDLNCDKADSSLDYTFVFEMNIFAVLKQNFW